MTIEQWRQAGDFFTYRGHQIFFRDSGGEQEVLLLLHGFPTASWDWWKVWDGLTQRFRVLAPDFIGFGYSDKPRPYPYSIFDQADLIETFLREKGITKCHLWSHDYGDTVAQELLARQNEGRSSAQFQSLALLNGGLFPGVYHPRLIQKLLMSPIGFLLSPLLSKARLRNNFLAIFGPQTPPSAAEIDAFWALITAKKGHLIAHRLIRYMGERQRHHARWTAALREAQIPRRLIDGGFDPISGAHMAQRYRELIPDPDVVILDHIGHYPQVEAPEQVLDHYLQFYQQHFGT